MNTLGNALKHHARSGRAISIRFARSGRLQVLGILAIAIAGVLGIASSSTAVGTFAPTIDLQTSTTRATSHPNARITIDNSASSEDIKDLTLDLPNGLWGSLAAADQCDYADAQADQCGPTSQIGSVVADAVVDQSDTRLRGKVYLTKPAPANVATDPAGIAIIVHAKVGGADLGNVIVNARVEARYAAPGPSSTTGAVGSVLGVRTSVTNVPRSITDSHSRTVTFRVTKMAIDLKSDLDGPKPPLLTNPSTCSTTSASATITSYDSNTTSPTDSYTTTDCNTVKFAPTVDITATDPIAGANTGMTTEIDFPADNASLKSIQVRMPSMLSANLAAFGSTPDRCPASAATSASSSFSNLLCPPQARIGTIRLETPLMPGPLYGDVYAIERALPWLGIDISPDAVADIGNTNPKGVVIRLVGITSTQQADESCDPSTDPSGFCQARVVASFSALPDAPATKMQLDLNRPDRPAGSGTLSGKLLSVAGNADPVCQPEDEFTAALTSNADAPSNRVLAARVDTQTFTGCDSPRSIVIDDSVTSPIGKTTTDTTPDIAWTSASSSFTCAIDTPSTTAVPCTSPFTPGSALTKFPHRVFVSDGVQTESRAFAIDAVTPTPDITVPTATVDSGPSGDTSDPTPSFTFSGTDDVTASGSLAFQCSVDDGAFLPCTSGFTTESFFASDTNHTFKVRSQDAAGNVSEPASSTFKVVIPFGPAMTVISSTNVARAHPDLDITIDNLSHEDVKDVTVSLPDGFFGGLQGVQELCGIAAADAGNCPAGSKVGTVETEGIVDESVIRINGEVFLTEARQPGDAAGISIKVPAVIQEIDMGDIIVPARLAVRGEAKGIDTMVVQVPNSIDPLASGNTYDSVTNFDLRKMTMKMRTNPGAAQPLLTNPSSCDTGSFATSFTGYNNTPATSNVPYPVAGCEALAFAPSLSASIKLPNGNPPNASEFQGVDLVAALNTQADAAGIKNASILMPKPLTMDVAKLPPLCEKAQYDLDACPSNTIIGDAVATTPLLLPTDPPLSGPVYLLRGENTVMPRLYVRLSGRITVRFVGKTSFENQTQLRTDFTDLPDAPLSSFTMKVTNLLSTMKKPCELGDKYGYSMTGTLTAHNNKTAGVDSPFVFDCAGVAYKYLFKKGKKAKRSKLSLTIETRGSKPKLKSAKIQFPKYLRLNKRALKRKLSLKVDGKRLKSKCFRYVNPGLLRLGLCGKKATKIELTFRPGSLVTNKKLRKGRLKITTVDVTKKTKRDSLNLFSKKFRTTAKLP